MTRRPRRIPVRHTIPGLLRDPLTAFERIGARADGEIALVDLGLFQPYLVTKPEHTQHILRDNVENYLRDGMMWRPLRRLLGDGIAADGDEWRRSRKIIQPLFTARRIANHLDAISDTIAEEVDRLVLRANEMVDSEEMMTRIFHRALVRAFFGGRISIANADRLCRSIAVVTAAAAVRMLLPFAPPGFPLPGDRSVRRATRDADEILFPLVRECRTQTDGTDANDLASLLCRAKDDEGRGLSDRRVRDDIVSIFAAGTETTSTAMTWLWVVLDANPDIAKRLYGEIETVVGDGPARPEHLPELQYTKMVLSELLRIYPIAWVLPRTAKNDDVIDGVRIRAGSTVIMSPYLTHRREDLWENPLVFDPGRFAPEHDQQRHRYAYFPFGGGIHQCLGSHLFPQEASLAIATVLSRLRPKIVDGTPSPRAGAALRPSRHVRIILQPREGRELTVPSSP